MGSKVVISPFISTIYRIPTTVRYSHQFPVSEVGEFQIMPNDFPIGVIVLAIGVIALRVDCPTWVIVMVGNNKRDSCPSR